MNMKVQKLEDLVRLLVASTGLAGWEETRRVDNLKRKMRLERELAERDYLRRMAAKMATGEERKRIVKREEQARKAEKVWKSHEETHRLRCEQIAAAEAALEVCVEDCVKTMTREELVL